MGAVRVSPEWKASIWAWMDVGIHHDVIRRRAETHVSYRTVSRYMKLYKAGWQDLNMLGHAPRSGRPRKTTPSQQFQIKRSLVSGKKALHIAERRNLSRRTIGRIAKKKRLSYGPMLRKPFLTTANRVNRFLFCERMRLRKYKWWRHVLWTDECPIPLTPSRKKYCWRELGTNRKYHFFEKNSSYLWVWAGISWHGITPIIFLNHNIGGKFTANRYIEQVLTKVPTMLKNLHGVKQMMEDGAPVHTAQICADFRTQHHIPTFPGNGRKWPARSPDLNPIENIWADLKAQLNALDHYPTTQTSMMKAISKIWKTYSLDFVRPFIDNMPDRLLACVKNVGGATKY